MNCREYIIEFEERGNLSEAATLHLTICADCRKTSDRQTQIWLMIERMSPVAAPSDFDFHVRARIAKTEPSDFRSKSFLPVLRYVLPLSVVILIFGLLAFSSIYFNNSAAESPIAQSSVIAAPTAPSASSNNFLPTNRIVTDDTPPAVSSPNAPTGAQLVTAKLSTKPNARLIKNVIGNRKRPARTAETETNPDDGLGSKDSAQTKQEPILPAGFSNKAANSTDRNIAPTKSIEDAELLNFFGIESVLKDGVRTIAALTKDSPAERSGAKVGDVIESLKNSSLTVRRGSQKIEISLLNQPNP